MARRIELTPEELVVHWDGLSSLAALARELRIPWESVSAVSIGLDPLPGALAVRVGMNTGPFGETRRGTFWSGGRRLFLDVNDGERAVVLDLEEHRYARVALTVDDPEGFAAQIRARAHVRR